MGFRGTATWGFEGRQRGFEAQQHGVSRGSNMGPGGTATSGMGPQGAAEGPRGTATWDRVIKGLHALSHNNCKTLIQAPSGTLDIRLFKIRLNSPRLGPSADRQSPFPLEWKEWKGVRNKQFLDKKIFQLSKFCSFFSFFYQYSAVQFCLAPC